MRKSICNTLQYSENRRTREQFRRCHASWKILRNVKAIGRTIICIVHTKTINNEPLLPNSSLDALPDTCAPARCHTLQVLTCSLGFLDNCSQCDSFSFSLCHVNLTKSIQVEGAPSVIICIYLYSLTLTSIEEKLKENQQFKL